MGKSSLVAFSGGQDSMIAILIYAFRMVFNKWIRTNKVFFNYDINLLNTNFFGYANNFQISSKFDSFKQLNFFDSTNFDYSLNQQTNLEFGNLTLFYYDHHSYRRMFFLDKIYNYELHLPSIIPNINISLQLFSANNNSSQRKLLNLYSKNIVDYHGIKNLKYSFSYYDLLIIYSRMVLNTNYGFYKNNTCDTKNIVRVFLQACERKFFFDSCIGVFQNNSNFLFDGHFKYFIKSWRNFRLRKISICAFLPLFVGLTRRKLQNEEISRQSRYFVLEQVGYRQQIKNTFVAHTATDKVETGFFRLFRGSTPWFLFGLTDSEKIRPFIWLSRWETKQLIKRYLLPITIDKTNFGISNKYSNGFLSMPLQRTSGFIDENKTFSAVTNRNILRYIILPFFDFFTTYTLFNDQTQSIILQKIETQVLSLQKKFIFRNRLKYLSKMNIFFQIINLKKNIHFLSFYHVNCIELLMTGYKNTQFCFEMRSKSMYKRFFFARYDFLYSSFKKINVSKSLRYGKVQEHMLHLSKIFYYEYVYYKSILNNINSLKYYPKYSYILQFLILKLLLHEYIYEI